MIFLWWLVVFLWWLVVFLWSGVIFLWCLVVLLSGGDRPIYLTFKLVLSSGTLYKCALWGSASVRLR